MALALSLGPWAVPVAVVALLLGVVAAELTAAFLAKRGYADAGAGLWLALLAALVVGRAVFVVRYWSAYRAHLVGILDIRDLGFSTAGALVALVLVIAALAWRRRAWRRALPIAAAAGVAVWALVGFTAAQLRSAAHPPLPALTLRTLDGQPVALASLAGKPLVVNLWATWCPPCRRELPMLVAAQRQLRGVRFVFVDQGESPARIRAFLRAERLQPRHVLLDANSRLSRYYHTPGYPTTVFLDAQGRLRDTHVGPLSRATLDEHLRRIVATGARSRPHTHTAALTAHVQERVRRATTPTRAPHAAAARAALLMR